MVTKVVGKICILTTKLLHLTLEVWHESQHDVRKSAYASFVLSIAFICSATKAELTFYLVRFRMQKVGTKISAWDRKYTYKNQGDLCSV